MSVGDSNNGFYRGKLFSSFGILIESRRYLVNQNSCRNHDKRGWSKGSPCR